jgi:3-oxoacyl-[acyl-carrier protein] reductase
MTRLASRVALVTGSSRGIGAAIARRLAADGAKVILHASTKPDQAEEVAKYIRDKGGIADVVTSDLSSRTSPGHMVRDAFAFHGALDILVNNAAISRYCLIGDLTAEEMDQEISVNLCAMMLATSEFVKLTKSSCGRVINISSGAGRHPA